ncbi:unnamed protein product, partial [Didymodactylos carnosus]
LWVKKANDFLRINNGEKLYGSRNGIQLLFDDYIGATLQFVSDFANSKRPYKGFLLYFIVTPDSPRTRPTTTTAPSTTEFNPFVGLFDEENDTKIQKDNDVVGITNYQPVLSKTGALIGEKQNRSTGLTLIVVVLTGALLVVLCAFLLYKRRNDRRVKYLSHMLTSLFPPRSRTVTLDRNAGDNGGNMNESLNNESVCKKLDETTETIAPLSFDEKSQKINGYDVNYNPTYYKHTNINERRDSQEKMIFIDNLKTTSSPYSSYKKLLINDKKREQDGKINLNDNDYSIDPVAFSPTPLNILTGISGLNGNNNHQNNDSNSLLYEYISPLDDTMVDNKSNVKSGLVQHNDDNYYSDIKNNDGQQQQQQQENYDQVIYATPSIKTNNENESHT